MSVIYEKIRADMLGARKSRNTDLVKVYSTLVGELELIGKRKNVDVDDTQVISTLKKFISNLHITREKQSEIPIVDIIDNEIRLYNMYLPQQLTADAINDILADIAPANIGEAMKHLKVNYAGKYDGKMASELIRDYINK